VNDLVFQKIVDKVVCITQAI